MKDFDADRPAAADERRPMLVAYRLGDAQAPLVCGPGSRPWMDATPGRYAYRCLPLLIANQAGWFVLNEHPFEAMWDGGSDLSGVHIRHLATETSDLVTSHFGSGVITWHLSYLFRTPPGYNLLVRGPSNSPKDGVQALEGLVESDWTYATFTMNWKLTRRNHWVRFERNEPICMLVPQRRGELERFHTALKDLRDDPELADGHRQWSESRARFLTDLRDEGSEAGVRKWQKHYFQGRSPDGSSSTEHQTVLALQPFDPDGPRDRSTLVRFPSDAEIAEAEPVDGRRPLRQPDYLLEKLDNEILLFHPGKTKALYLNETATLVWELCNGERTITEILELLRDAFPEAAATIDDDVRSALREFAEQEAVAFV